MDRRHFLALSSLLAFTGRARASDGGYEVTRSDAEWRELLTPLQYKVMRREATEPPGSSPLDKVYDPGMYHCRGCDLALYSSEH